MFYFFNEERIVIYRKENGSMTTLNRVNKKYLLEQILINTPIEFLLRFFRLLAVGPFSFKNKSNDFGPFCMMG